ncbi:MAG TPA: hypothetical protein VFF11_12525 [Candidatus Binatia bacterium]|nr:hypothetical protein [Candidatus Binatia bacterium]
MKQHLKIEMHGSHGETIQDRPTVATATANIGVAEADSSKPAKQDEITKIETEFQTEPRRADQVALLLIIAVMVILTVVAGYIFWKKVSLTF